MIYQQDEKDVNMFKYCIMCRITIFTKCEKNEENMFLFLRNEIRKNREI